MGSILNICWLAHLTLSESVVIRVLRSLLPILMLEIAFFFTPTPTIRDRSIISLIMLQMNHPPPSNELVKSREAVLGLIYFPPSHWAHLSASSSGSFVFIVFTAFKCIVVSTDVTCVRYFANNPQMEREEEETAESIMKGKLDNGLKRSQAAFVPNEISTSIYLYGTPSQPPPSPPPPQTTPMPAPEKLSCTCRNGLISLEFVHQWKEK